MPPLQRTTRCAPRPAPGGFTMVELLIVVVIIAMLVALLVVAASGVMSRGRAAATEQFLRNLAFAAEQFHADFGYHPPLMNDRVGSEGDGLLIEAHSAASTRMLEEQRFNSVFSLPVYLVGVGRLHPDALDDETDAMPERHDGHAGPGFRDPGPDRAWGGAANRANLNPTRRGRVFGPYMDVGAGENMRLVRPEDVEHLENVTFEQVQQRFVFVDRWDTPIRYYRQIPTRDRREQPPEINLERVPIELLRHEVVRSAGQTTGGVVDLDPSLERNLLNAPFAILSAGSDGIFADAPFVRERITEDFSNTARIVQLESGQQRDYEDLLESLRDNVRVTP